MSGPATGKLKLSKASVYLLSKSDRVKLKNAIVYIHLKGYADARVTHLDIEHERLDNVIPPKRGLFLSIHGMKGGLKIKLENEKEVVYENKEIDVVAVEVKHPYLSSVLKPDEKTRTWVGGKFGGIYIGFRKSEIVKMEKLAEKKFKMKPL